MLYFRTPVAKDSAKTLFLGQHMRLRLLLDFYRVSQINVFFFCHYDHQVSKYVSHHNSMNFFFRHTTVSGMCYFNIFVLLSLGKRSFTSVCRTVVNLLCRRSNKSILREWKEKDIGVWHYNTENEEKYQRFQGFLRVL